MRHLSLAALALAATLGASGAAFAADDLSREQADQEAVGQYQANLAAPMSALGYSAAREETRAGAAHPLANVRMSTPAPDDTRPTTPDQLFLQIGDHGIGNE